MTYSSQTASHNKHTFRFANRNKLINWIWTNKLANQLNTNVNFCFIHRYRYSSYFEKFTRQFAWSLYANVCACLSDWICNTICECFYVQLKFSMLQMKRKNTFQLKKKSIEPKLHCLNCEAWVVLRLPLFRSVSNWIDWNGLIVNEIERKKLDVFIHLFHTLSSKSSCVNHVRARVRAKPENVKDVAHVDKIIILRGAIDCSMEHWHELNRTICSSNVIVIHIIISIGTGVIGFRCNCIKIRSSDSHRFSWELLNRKRQTS